MSARWLMLITLSFLFDSELVTALETAYGRVEGWQVTEKKEC